MMTSNIQLGFLLTRGGGQAVQGGLSCPHLEFQTEWIICKFYYTIYYKNICWKRYKHYFSQSEMLTSNVQLGYILTRGGGQAVQGGLSCPSPRISKRMDNQQFFIKHHLLQKYLVERDINFISVNLRCLLQRFIWVTYWQGVGGKLSRAVYLAPRPEFQRELIIPKFYYTICYRNI